MTGLDQAGKLGLAAAAILALGAFMPVLTVPIIGSLDLFMNGKGDGALIVGLAVGIAIAAVARWHLATGLLSAIALAVIVYDFVKFRRALSQMATELDGNPFAGLAQAATRMQFGWIVLFAGAVTGIAAWWVSRHRQTSALTTAS